MTFIRTLFSISLLLFTFNTHAASVWKVSSKTHSLYIGGTIHILTPDDYPLPKEYDIAYQNSNKLVFETDMVAVSQAEFAQKMMSLMTYSDGTTIDKVLDADTYQALVVFLSSKGVPIQALAAYKPGMIAITLSLMELNAMGYTSEGVDVFYSKMATANNKPQAWLETPDEQLQFLANMGNEDPSAMIDYTLKDIATMEETFGKLHKAWFKGDMSAMADVGITPFKADYPGIYDDLIATRNNNWLPQIVSMLDDEPKELILVGALHLSGPDGVLAKLKAKGYSVEQL
ncbi:TraB/GumN family protein [uncultured Paraglaciecola sp.]|uniref:TraB/GumN family protein n=1 Tax=uncultured Paraglaciecola sp. TaxID=1765024 RepID=UPI00259A1CB6|nr:TraB/GumN family protein [uncultured Paraglaciecola sp.]